MNDTCPRCGGCMLGDGYHEVLCCENADRPDDVEPDAAPIYCEGCTFPDCGCYEARLCNARNPNSAAMALINRKL